MNIVVSKTDRFIIHYQIFKHFCVGSSVMQNGITLKNNYGLDLDSVQTGAVIGMKRHIDGTLHYYLDGEDKGEACSGLPTGVYPVIDLYGQCAQVGTFPNRPYTFR